MEVATRTQANTTTPEWLETFHMCVQNAAHALRVVAVHDAHKGTVLA